MRRVLILLLKIAGRRRDRGVDRRAPGPGRKVAWLGYVGRRPASASRSWARWCWWRSCSGLWRVWHGLVVRATEDLRPAPRRLAPGPGLPGAPPPAWSRSPRAIRNRRARHARKADQLLEDPPLDHAGCRPRRPQLDRRRGRGPALFRGDAEAPGRPSSWASAASLTQALKEGDRPRALQLARRAKKINPETPWLLRDQLRSGGRISGAGTRRWFTLYQMTRVDVIPADRAKHHKAAILVEQEPGGRGRRATRRRRWNWRHKGDHSWSATSPPARCARRGLLLRQGRDRQARKAVEKAWARRPHRELAEVWRRLGPEHETPAGAGSSATRSLAKLTPDDPVADHGAGRGGAGGGAVGAPPATTWRRRSPRHRTGASTACWRISRRRSTATPRRRVTGSPRPRRRRRSRSGTCRDCGTPSPVWNALCEACGAFDSMEWKGSPPAMVLLPSDGDGAMLAAARGAAGGRHGVGDRGRVHRSRGWRAHRHGGNRPDRPRRPANRAANAPRTVGGSAAPVASKRCGKPVFAVSPCPSRIANGEIVLAAARTSETRTSTTRTSAAGTPRRRARVPAGEPSPALAFKAPDRGRPAPSRTTGTGADGRPAFRLTPARRAGRVRALGRGHGLACASCRPRPGDRNGRSTAADPSAPPRTATGRRSSSAGRATPFVNAWVGGSSPSCRHHRFPRSFRPP